MSKKYEKLTKSAIAIAILFFVARCFISTPSSMYDFCGCIGESTTVSLFLVLLYNHCLWKINPISSIPKIYGSFKGTIEYKYNDEVGIKEVDVSIKQTFLNTKVYLESDEMKSAAIMCDIVDENGLVYLYYTYITNPKAKYSEKNPMKYGSCRMEIKSKFLIEGVYWTSGKTSGDIKFENIKNTHK